MVAGISARVAPISQVLTAAADTDPDAAQLAADAARHRMYGATAFIGHLASLDGLAPGITRQHAADLCWAITDPHLYLLLVIERGWTTPDFTEWLTGALAKTLLGT
jgi:hypothetical protein